MILFKIGSSNGKITLYTGILSLFQGAIQGTLQKVPLHYETLVVSTLLLILYFGVSWLGKKRHEIDKAKQNLEDETEKLIQK